VAIATCALHTGKKTRTFCFFYQPQIPASAGPHFRRAYPQRKPEVSVIETSGCILNFMPQFVIAL